MVPTELMGEGIPDPLPKSAAWFSRAVSLLTDGTLTVAEIAGIAEVIEACGDPFATWYFLKSDLYEIGYTDGFQALKAGALRQVLSLKLARDLGAFS